MRATPRGPEHGRERRRARTKPSHATLNKTQRALKQVLPQVPLKAITPSAAVVDDLGLDSLKAAQLSLELEQAFGRPIFVGDLFSEVEDPRSMTVLELATLIEQST